MENVPDLLTWFENARKVLVPGGRIYLIAPDKRFTFDSLRPLSTLGQVLGNHFEQRDTPRFDAVFDNLYLFRHVTSLEVWEGRQDPIALSVRFDVKRALELAKAFWERHDASIHSHVFTYHSFLEILEGLREGGLLPFQVVMSHDVYRPYNEFYVTLERL